MTLLRNIVTHRGTGTDTVAELLGYWDARLTVVTSRDQADKIGFDGLILLGGADIAPFWYGERYTHSRPANQERDIIEWTLVRRALSARVPILGICRGCQMLAVAAGGSLYQDIQAQTGKDHDRSNHRLHEVKRPLANHLPTHTVNSLHHQAIKTTPPGFQVVALAPDGIIEAIYRPGMLGVQFHPELLFPKDPRWEGLFYWFLEGLM